MKTSKKILIGFTTFTFAMLFITFASVNNEIKKIVIDKVNTKAIKLNNFSHLLLSPNANLRLSLSEQNNVYGDVSLNDFVIKNDTLIINTETSIKIDFEELKSITCADSCNVIIDSINTDYFNLIVKNKSFIKIRHGNLDNVNIYAEKSSVTIKYAECNNVNIKADNKSKIYLNSKETKNVNAKLTNKSYLIVLGDCKTKVDCDAKSTFYKRMR